MRKRTLQYWGPRSKIKIPIQCPLHSSRKGLRYFFLVNVMFVRLTFLWIIHASILQFGRFGHLWPHLVPPKSRVKWHRVAAKPNHPLLWGGESWLAAFVCCTADGANVPKKNQTAAWWELPESKQLGWLENYISSFWGPADFLKCCLSSTKGPWRKMVLMLFLSLEVMMCLCLGILPWD